MPENDAWDWTLLMYTATVILRRTEKQFWSMTPRKLNALTRKHIEMNPTGDESEGPSKAAYIDQVI